MEGICSQVCEHSEYDYPFTVQKELKFSGEVLFIGHHLAHSAVAFLVFCLIKRQPE